jgi:hypothetical protein
MSQHPIYISEVVYQLLAQRAAAESRSLEQVAERLLTAELSFVAEADYGQTEQVSGNATEALAAVHRLTTLFADVEFSDIEQVLNDPMLALANEQLDTALL